MSSIKKITLWAIAVFVGAINMEITIPNKKIEFIVKILIAASGFFAFNIIIEKSAK